MATTHTLALTLFALTRLLGTEPTRTHASSPTEVRALQQERIDLLARVYQRLIQRQAAGAVSPESTDAAHLAWIQAALEATGSPAERLPLLREQVAVEQEALRRCQQRHQAGLATEEDVMLARAKVIGAQVALLREEGRK